MNRPDPPVAPVARNRLERRIEHRRPKKAATLSVRQVSQILKIPLRTTYYYARTGELPVVRIGRSIKVLQKTVDELLARGEMPQPHDLDESW